MNTNNCCLHSLELMCFQKAIQLADRYTAFFNEVFTFFIQNLGGTRYSCVLPQHIFLLNFFISPKAWPTHSTMAALYVLLPIIYEVVFFPQAFESYAKNTIYCIFSEKNISQRHLPHHKHLIEVVVQYKEIKQAGIMSIPALTCPVTKA